MRAGLRLMIGYTASIIAVFSMAMVGCTTSETPTAAVPTAPSEAATAPPTDTPAPAPTATDAPPTPTFTAVPTATLMPPTNTPAPTVTPQPEPTATPAATPRPTYTPRPQSSPTPIPTFAPRPTNTPTIPSAIRQLENGDWLADNERARASQIATLAWVADGLAVGETGPAQRLVDLAVWYPEVFSSLMKKPWVQDSITQAETDAIFGFRWLARYANEQVDGLLAMPWAQDDITEPEGRAVRYFYYTGRYARPLANELHGKSWVHDDITADEATVIQNLYWTARPQDEALADEVLAASISILGMPFLESVDPPDAQAVRSLQRLEYKGSARFLEIVSHPQIADGITDEDAKIVALLYGTSTYRPESVEVLLRGTGVFLEELVINLPLSGEVLLTIIRVRDQITPTMEFLEHSVRIAEEFMDAPLPSNYIAYYFDDAVLATAGGQNFGTHIASKLHYDVENGHSWWRTPYHMAHEVGHYYWRSNAGWIDEGAADVMGAISENRRVDEPVEPRRRPCASADTISELEKLGDSESIENRKLYRCNYPLGERLFLDLYDALGEETFRRGFRTLYLKSLAEDYSDDCDGTALGICHLVAAFKADVTEAQAAMVDEIVARWYGPLP